MYTSLQGEIYLALGRDYQHILVRGFGESTESTDQFCYCLR